MITRIRPEVSALVDRWFPLTPSSDTGFWTEAQILAFAHDGDDIFGIMETLVTLAMTGPDDGFYQAIDPNDPTYLGSLALGSL